MTCKEVAMIVCGRLAASSVFGLRRALALAIDRETLVRVVLGAGEMPAWSVVPPGVGAYEPALMEETGWTQQQREAEAIRLFKRSGFGGREPLMLDNLNKLY